MSYYAVAVFLSAFLLFQIQPLIGKYVLPWFGGTPAVWSTSMLFFQVFLTGGYAYAYWLAGRPRQRQQGGLHLTLLALSLLLLLLLGLSWATPITPDVRFRPTDPQQPIGHLFQILALSVGLPYFLLSTNGPLMQAWFNRDYPRRSPYRLYAISNAGSLLGLVSYPFLFELLPLRTQARLWSLGYLAFALWVGFAAVRALRSRQVLLSDNPQAHNSPGASPGRGMRLLWVGLPAVASVMLLATTSQITQEVAVIPFLWVLPLTLYLLSFVLCFSAERWYSRTGYAAGLLVGSGFFVWALAQKSAIGFIGQIAIYCLVLFVCCMICHGELARLKPDPRYLTTYYLLISVGGAIGGIAVSLVAPLVFRGYWELHLGLLGCWLLLLIVAARDRPRVNRRFGQRIQLTAIAGVTAILGVILLVQIQWSSGSRLLVLRNFYGVVYVSEINQDSPDLKAYQLVHGSTVHGSQYEDPTMRDELTTYYTAESGVNLALLHYPRGNEGLRIGVLGLGIGTVAAFGQPGDTIRFYEINPAVVALARGEGGYFSFLADCRARVEIVEGDARISLEGELREGHPQQYDILVLDVFSSDSIPMHLLTREAFEVYLQHLRPQGVLALNMTNRYLDLRPVVWGLADHFGLDAALIESPGDGVRSYHSVWMLLTSNRDFLQQLEIAEHTTPRLVNFPLVGLWTDDYSNLFRILK